MQNSESNLWTGQMEYYHIISPNMNHGHSDLYRSQHVGSTCVWLFEAGEIPTSPLSCPFRMVNSVPSNVAATQTSKCSIECIHMHTLWNILNILSAHVVLQKLAHTSTYLCVSRITIFDVIFAVVHQPLCGLVFVGVQSRYLESCWIGFLLLLKLS